MVFTFRRIPFVFRKEIYYGKRMLGKMKQTKDFPLHFEGLSLLCKLSLFGCRAKEKQNELIGFREKKNGR